MAGLFGHKIKIKFEGEPAVSYAACLAAIPE